jgi:hypothetical protein
MAFHRRAAALQLGLGLGSCVLVAGASALAQSHIMVMENDDGSGAPPTIMRFSMPDFRSLLTPEFLRRDRPIFDRRLVLSPPQSERLGALIDEYLEKFEALRREYVPAGGPMAMHLGDMEGGGGFALALPGEMGDGEFEGPDGFGAIVGDAIRAAGGTLDVEAGPGAVAVAISIGAPTDDEADVVAPTEGGVMVSVETSDDVELPEEVRAQLEAKAQELAENMRAKMEAQAAAGEPAGPFGGDFDQHVAAMEKLAAKAEEMEAARKRLRQEFVASVQTELDEEQLARWPSLERALTRSKTLPNGRLDGERTDLVSVLDGLELPEPIAAPVAALVEQYEIALHDALVRRNEFVAEAEKKVDEALEARDPEKALDVVDRATQLRIAVREVNDDYLLALGETLRQTSEEQSKALVEAAQLTSFPRVYRQTRGQKAFEQARAKIADEDTIVRILEIEHPYRNELEDLNRRLEAAIRREQPLEPRRMIEHLAADMRGEAPPPGDVAMLPGTGGAVDEVLSLRRDLDERTMKTLYAILPPDVVAQLPKLPSQVQRGPIIIRQSATPPN